MGVTEFILHSIGGFSAGFCLGYFILLFIDFISYKRKIRKEYKNEFRK